MCTKRKSSSSAPTTARKGKATGLDIKVKVITLYGEKKENAFVCGLQILHSTMSIILKDEDCSLETMKGLAPIGSTMIIMKCTTPIHEIQKMLQAS
ncbi:hypothetical protein SK128_002954 [Halocaridina rubra]|uniref:Uncharacterized protein n=1 Tax=Halocaridina rubra TaxID=373956 RepID=A0AAN8WYB7_HALRR